MRRSSLLIGAKDSETRRASIAEDAAQLARLGHEQELKRNFSFISMLGLAFAILVRRRNLVHACAHSHRACCRHKETQRTRVA